jgi:quercetin dioxygenase-like cupin family protein
MSTSAKSKHVAWKNVEREQLNPLIGREMLVGDKIMLARVLMKKGAHVPLHHHHNEQVTYILEGALKFAIDGKEIVVRAGEVLCIPPHMPHEAWALEDTVDLDVFDPPAAQPDPLDRPRPLAADPLPLNTLLLATHHPDDKSQYEFE